MIFAFEDFNSKHLAADSDADAEELVDDSTTGREFETEVWERL